MIKKVSRNSGSPHRLMGGKQCVADFVAGVTGLPIPFNAEGVPVAQSGFAVLAVTWPISTFQAPQVVRPGQITPTKTG